MRWLPPLGNSKQSITDVSFHRKVLHQNVVPQCIYFFAYFNDEILALTLSRSFSESNTQKTRFHNYPLDNKQHHGMTEFTGFLIRHVGWRLPSLSGGK